MSSLGTKKIESINRLSQLQNKALRIIHFKTSQDSANTLYNKSKILKLNEHIFLQNSLLAYDQINDLLPKPFKSFLNKVNDNHYHNTRGSKHNHLIPPENKTTFYGTFSVRSQSVANWNEIIDKLNFSVNDITRTKLQDLITNHLLDTYTNENS